MTPEQLHQTYREAMDLSFKASYMIVCIEPLDDIRAVMMLALEKMKLCAECLRDKADCQPTRAVIFRCLGSMYFCLNMYQDAIDTLNEALNGCLDHYEKETIHQLLKECQDEID